MDSYQQFPIQFVVINVFGLTNPSDRSQVFCPLKSYAQDKLLLNNNDTWKDFNFEDVTLQSFDIVERNKIMSDLSNPMKRNNDKHLNSIKHFFWSPRTFF